MTGWLIYDKKGFERNRWFADRLKSYLGCELIIAEELEFGTENGIYFKYGGKYLPCPDYAVQRCIYPLLSEVLEADGARVFNSARVSGICCDKRRTHLFAVRLGIPSVKTAFTDKRFLSLPEMPFILKSADGHGGTEVFSVKNKTELEYALLHTSGRDMLIQREVSDTGVDKRIYLLGGKILASVIRRSKSGFRSNFSLGGDAALCDISPLEAETVNKISAGLKPDFVGIDFIYDKGVPYLNEIEDAAGTRMLYSLTDIDAAGEYADYILHEMDSAAKHNTHY